VIASLLRDEGLLQREIEAVLFAIGLKDRHRLPNWKRKHSLRHESSAPLIQ
jgi:hypothetical protein